MVLMTEYGRVEEELIEANRDRGEDIFGLNISASVFDAGGTTKVVLWNGQSKM